MATKYQFMTTLICILFFGISLFAEYKEGIDTTYSNGYGLDGAFRAQNNSIYAENKMAVFHFDYPDYRWHYFKYSFDEINIAPIIPSNNWVNEYACATPLNKPFVVKRENNTYAKVEIINQMPSGEYVFKYGLNNEPSNSILAPGDYDKDSLYKPNNMIFCITDPVDKVNPFADVIRWDTPLENNNELIGYKVYKVDINTNIDTSQEIDLSEWELEAFVTGNETNNGSPYYNIERNVYWNIVAVYKNNNDTIYSKPLKGWTLFPDWVCKTNFNQSKKTDGNEKITITNNHNTFNDFSGNTYETINLYDLLGRRVFSINNNRENNYIKSNQNLSTGVYAIEAFWKNNSKKVMTIKVK